MPRPTDSSLARGRPNGLASLDADGLVPLSELANFQPELAAEEADRIAADDAEEAARITADAAEEAARIAADNAETAARIAADDAEEADRIAADAAEEAARIATDAIIDAALAAHLADAIAAHTASAIANVPSGAISATTVQAALDELDTEKATTGSVATVASDLAAHQADATDAHDASAVSNVPLGTIAATDVQAALNELDGDKQAVSEKGNANGYASLDGGGKIPTSQLPSIAITDTYEVASEAAQLALVVEQGDVAVRSDESKSYIQNGGTSGTMADWTLLRTPTDTVLSVFGRTGVVAATAGDYNAALITNTPAGDISAVTVQGALNELDTEKATTGSVAAVASDLAAHIADPADAHAAAAVTNTPAGTVAAVTVQAAINELDGDRVAEAAARASADGVLATAISDHIADPTDAHAASAITNNPAGTITAATVQAALNELDSLKLAIAALAANIAAFLAAPSSANLRAALTDETGNGAAYFQNGDLGTPSAGVATNLTGTASGLTAGTVTTNANLTGNVTSVGNTTTIPAGTVTNAMQANMAQGTLKYRVSGSGPPQDTLVGTFVSAAKGTDSNTFCIGNDARLNVHMQVDVVATSNIDVLLPGPFWPINGSPFPGLGGRVLLTAQTNPIENGMWMTGSLSTDPFPTNTLFQGQNDLGPRNSVGVGIRGGDLFRVGPFKASDYAGTYWQVTTPTSNGGVVQAGTTAVAITRVPHPTTLPIFKTSLAYSQVIETDEQCIVYGPLAITAGTLVINGSGKLTILNTPYGS